MAIQFRKPVLIGGVGLSFGLWFWSMLPHAGLQDSFLDLGETGVWSVMLLGGGLWWWKKSHRQPPKVATRPVKLTPKVLEEEREKTQVLLETLATEAPQLELTEFKTALEQLPQRLQTQLQDQKMVLQGAIAGRPLTGKSTLQKALQSHENIKFIEENAETTLQKSHFVIFLVTGDLTESELKTLQMLKNQHQSVILGLNKQDRYPEEEKALILQQVKQRTLNVIAAEDIVTLAAAPSPVKVRQYQENGEMREFWEDQQPDLVQLCDRITHKTTQDKTQLLYGASWRETKQLQHTLHSRLNEVRRDRAMPIIEKYQWIAAAAAFANPVSALDLLATAAINTQLLIDLSALYQQKMTLTQAQKATGTIGELMVKLGVVEISSHAIAPLLKSNALTYMAGGTMQGVSAAYFTRIAGLSLVAYLQDQTLENTSETGFNLEQFSSKLKTVFQQTQRSQILQKLVPQTLIKLKTIMP